MLHFWMQAVSSDTGKLIDDFTLVKPANWTPNVKARSHIIDYFVSNYTASYIEDPGVCSKTIRGKKPSLINNIPCKLDLQG